MTGQQPALVYLREIAGPREAPRGHVIGMTMPLQPAIAKRWQEGELHRVTEDGDPWPGGDVLPGHVEPELEPEPEPEGEDGTPEEPAAGEATPAGDNDPDMPLQPRGNARKEEWIAYAVAMGAVTEDEAPSMTQGELRALFTQQDS